MSNTFATKRGRQTISFLLAVLMIVSSLGSYSLTSYAAGDKQGEISGFEMEEFSTEEFSTEEFLQASLSENDVETETTVVETEATETVESTATEAVETTDEYKDESETVEETETDEETTEEVDTEIVEETMEETETETVEETMEETETETVIETTEEDWDAMEGETAKAENATKEVADVLRALESNETPESYTLNILADSDAVNISARIGAQAVTYEMTDNVYEYTVSANDTVTVTVKANENYKITKAVTKNGTLPDKTEKSKAAGFVYSIKMNANVQTQIDTEALYQALLMQDDTIIENTKKGYTVSPGVYIADIMHGNTKALLSEVIVENKLGEKTTGELSEDSHRAEFTVDSKDAGNNNLKYTVKTADGKEIAFALKVRPSIQKVTIKGAKNGVIKQTVDTEKIYNISLAPAKASINNLYIEKEGDIEAVLEKNQLKITTKTTVVESQGVIRFYQKTDADEEGTEIADAAITVTSVEPAALKKAKPTVKLAEADDTTLTFTLATPANVEKPVQGAQYYEIKMTPDATTTVPEEIVAACSEPIYRLRDGNFQTETVSANTIGAGMGRQWNYSVEVRLVQTSEKKNVEDVSVADITYSSKGRSIEASTLKPAYETVLKVKKGAGSVYTGQGEVCIATPVFSKKTSYKVLEKVLDITDGLSEDAKLQLAYKDGKIYAVAPAGSNVAIGKHTIVAYAIAPAGSKAATVTFTVNVVRGIEDLSVTMAANALYKKYNKPVSVGIITAYNELVTAKLPEAKSKKVIYSVVDADGKAFTSEDALYGMVTIKKGKATVNKNYVVSSNKSDNVFCIKVTANDYKGNTVCAYSEPIEICSTTVAPGEVVLVSKQVNQDNAYDVISRGNETLKIEELNGSKVVVTKKGIASKNALVAEDLLDIKAFNITTNNKALSIAEDGSLCLEQAMNNLKITATTKDGSNLKASLEKLKVEYSDALALGVNISRATYKYTGVDAQFYTIGSPDSTTVKYTAGKNEIFKLDVLRQDEDGNWLTIDDDAYMNYTMSLKGGQQISKDKDTYLISATEAKTVITLTDKANNRKKSTYTLVNEALNNKSLPSLEVTVADTLAAGYYEGNQILTLNLTAGGDYSYYDEEGMMKYAEVRVDVADSLKNKEKYDSLTKFTSGIDGYHSIDEIYEYEYDEEGNETGSKVTRTISISFSKEDYTDIVAGNYKLNVTLGTVQHGDFVPDTKTKSVTVGAVAKTAAKLTFNPVAKYVLNTKDADAVELTGQLNKKNYTYYFTGAHNVIENGEVNQFLNYFDFIRADVVNAVPAKLKLKQGIDLSMITDFDEKAFVDYQIYDKDGRMVKEESVLIQVDVQDASSKYMIRMLSFIEKTDGSTMFATGDVTCGSKPANFSHALFLSDVYSTSANGTSTVRVTTDIIPDRGMDRLNLYIIPTGSYYEPLLDECRDSGDSERYEKLMQEYGAEIRNVTLRFQEDRGGKVRLPGSASLSDKNFTRDTKLTGEYIVPLKMLKSTVAAEIDYIEITGDASAYAKMDVATDAKGNEVVILTVDKYNLALSKMESMQMGSSQIEYTIHYTEGLVRESGRIMLKTRGWQTYDEVLRRLEVITTKLNIKSKWTGEPDVSVEMVKDKAVSQLGKYVKADSHAMLSVSANDAELVLPTRTTQGEMKVYATLVNTIPEFSENPQETEKHFTFNVIFPALGAWPEDIADELGAFLNGYHTEADQKIFNQTKAEDIAAAIKAQDFIQKYSWLRVDVSNVVKQKATDLEEGTLSARVRIIDTTHGGQPYDQVWTWTLYELDTLQEAADRLAIDLAAAEVNNRITQEDTAALIDASLINEDIKWTWKKVTVNNKEVDDYTKTLATVEEEGTVKGTIILQNPKSLIDPTQALEVPITIQIQKMTDPAIIHEMVNNVVGQNVLTYEMFSKKVYIDEVNDEYEWVRLSEKEMRQVVLDTAGKVLLDADELYYVEYAKDEDEKDIFHYQKQTYKVNESVSYTLVIRDECTEEIVGEPIIVNEFVLADADGSLQTLENWQDDIEALIEEGNANGTFTNDITEFTIIELASSVQTNWEFTAELKYVDNEETSESMSDFVLTPATMENSGSATATLYLVHEEDMGTDEDGMAITEREVITMKVKLIIPEIDQSMEEAVMAISNVLSEAQMENEFSNKTTADDIFNLAKANIKSKKFALEWSQPFALIEATREEAGGITGELRIINNKPESGEETVKTVEVSILINKLKTADEAQVEVENAVGANTVYAIIEKANTEAQLKSKILAIANQIVQHDGFTVSVKQENGEEVFGYQKNTHKEDGYVYYTLLLTSNDGNEDDIREIVIENIILSMDVNLQTGVLAISDVKERIMQMATNGEITNDTTKDDLIWAAREVIVNPMLQIDESGCKVTVKPASERTQGYLTFIFIIQDENGKRSNGSIKVNIPKLEVY